MTDYYQADVMRASWAELWRFSPSFLFFIGAAILRLARVRRIPLWGVARNGLRFIEPNTIPDYALSQLQTTMELCNPLGFRSCLWCTTDSIGAIEGYSSLMLHYSGTIYASIVFARSMLLDKPRDKIVVAMSSRQKDGRFLFTTNAKKQWNSPSVCLCEHLPGCALHDVLRRHQERLSGFPLSSIIRFDEPLVRETALEASKQVQDFQISRGVWVQLSEDQVTAIRNRLGQAR